MFTQPVKIKIKTLASEARHIKREEIKKLEQARFYRYSSTSDNATRAEGMSIYEYEQLRRHRKDTVGREARSSLIAYGFIRGRKYSEIEFPRSTKPVNVDSVSAMVYKYDESLNLNKEDTKIAVEKWLNE